MAQRYDAGFFRQGLAIVEAALTAMGATPAAFATAKQAFQTAFNDLDLVSKTDPSSVLTAKLLALDARRDSLFTGLSLLVKAYTYHNDEEVKAAARLLEHNLKLYGPRLTIQPYVEETSNIAGFLKDWQTKPELAGATAVIPGLAAFTTPLAQANAEFEKLYIDRNNEASEKPDFNVEEAQAKTTTAYELLTKKVSSFVLASDDSAPWQKLEDQLTAHWKKYESTDHLKEGKAEAAKEPTKPA